MQRKKKDYLIAQANSSQDRSTICAQVSNTILTNLDQQE
jgi:hypothetical protein